VHFAIVVWANALCRVDARRAVLARPAGQEPREHGGADGEVVGDLHPGVARERVLHVPCALVLQLRPDDAVDLVVDRRHRELVLVVVQAALPDLPRCPLGGVLHVQVGVEEVCHADQARPPHLAQGSVAEVIVWPAVGMEDDQPREMHQLLFAEDRARAPVAQPLEEGLAELPVPDDLLHEPLLQTSALRRARLRGEPGAQVRDGPEAVRRREPAQALHEIRLVASQEPGDLKVRA
jgi:hypothetical protein